MSSLAGLVGNIWLSRDPEVEHGEERLTRVGAPLRRRANIVPDRERILLQGGDHFERQLRQVIDDPVSPAQPFTSERRRDADSPHSGCVGRRETWG